MEVWRDVINFVGYYKVSNRGRLKSLSRKVKGTNGKVRYLYSRLMKVKPSGKGYISVSLSKNSHVTTAYLHRVVWEAFRGPIPFGKEINHKDGIKRNCHISNLELKTHKGNMHHAHRTRLHTIFDKGSGNGSAKLTEPRVAKIKERIRRGDILRSIAKDNKVCPQTITAIKQGLLWSHVD